MRSRAEYQQSGYLVCFFGCMLPLPWLVAPFTNQRKLEAFAIMLVCTALFAFYAMSCMRHCTHHRSSNSLLTAHGVQPMLRAATVVVEALIVAGVQCVVFHQLFVRFAESFALTEACVGASTSSNCAHRQALCVCQLACLVWLKSFRFFFKAYQQYSDPNQVAHWQSASVRVECLLHGVAVGVTMLLVANGPLLLSCSTMTAKLARTRLDATQRNELHRHLRRNVAVMCGLFVLIVFCIVTPLVSLVMRANCWLWTVESLLMPRHRGVFALWVALLVVAISAAPRSSLVPLTVRRKFFHLISLAALVPPACLRSGSPPDDAAVAGRLSPAYASALGRLASGGALAFMFAAELIRFAGIAPGIDAYMRRFIDERDAGRLILTHIYLLLGCALPLWLDTEFRLHPLAAFTGLLIIGVGDAAASAVGAYCGTWKWPSSDKSLQGTAAAFLSTMLAAAALNAWFAHNALAHLASTHDWTAFTLATLVVCLIEAFTDDVDNLMLPGAYLLALFAFRAI